MFLRKRSSNLPAVIKKKPAFPLSRMDLADRLHSYLIFEDMPCNFAISGQGDKEHLIKHVLGHCFKRMPVIILHNQNHGMLSKVAQVWQEEFESLEYADGGPLWSCDHGGFEPFLEMDDEDVVQILVELAQVAGYSNSAVFEKVVRAHLKILHHAHLDVSLTGLHYLCSFEDLEEFQNNIMALECSLGEKNQIMASIGIIGDSKTEALDNFRSIISRLSYQAAKSGWSQDQAVGCMNITTAIQNNAVMALNVNSSNAAFLLAYLGHELRLHLGQNLLLLIDEVNLTGTGIPAVLKDAAWDFRFGILGGNVLDLMDSDTETAQKFCEKLDLMILTKHRTATVASPYSDLIGTVQAEKQTTTYSRGKEFLAFLPDHENESRAYTLEDRPRVRVDQIQNLHDKQVILFDTSTNGVLLL